MTQGSSKPILARSSPVVFNKVGVTMPRSDLLLKVEHLSAAYGEIRVLWGVDIEVEVGEIACLVGSNGAGKTTLLRVLSGQLRPSNGRITFMGEDITNLSPRDILARGIAHVPEGRRLFKGLSVRDNLLLGAYLRRDDAGIKRDLDYVLSVF